MSVMEPILEEHPQLICVRDAVMSTFAMFLGAAPAYTGILQADESREQIVSILSLVGERTWSLMLHLPRATAEALALKFAGFEIPFDSADMGDVAGELMNVVAGSVTAHLEAAGIKAEMGLPTVVSGSDLRLPLPEGLNRVQMGFHSDDGPFSMAVTEGDARHVARRSES